MSRRRVLILVHFFPPLAGGGVHRTLAFVRHLPAHGWDCTVVCAGEQDYWVRDESLTALVPPATEVLRVPGGSALSAWLRVRRKDAAGRRSGGTFASLRALADWALVPDPYVGWSRRAGRVARRRLGEGGIDVVLSSSPPDSAHLAALAALAGSRLPYVADFRDPWVGLHFRQPPTAWHRARHAALERRVLERADLVLTASRTHLDTLGAASGAHARRAELLPNGFEPAGADAGEVVPDPASFRLVFTGTLSLMDDAGTLLEAVHEVLAHVPEARRRLRVDIVGPYETHFEDRALALGLVGIVRFLGPRTHREARAMQRSADALLLWKPLGAGYRTMVPGKLYEYLDSGRPILALLPAADEAAALVRRGGGVVIAPGDRAALARELETRYTAWRARGRTPDARPDWLGEHARPALAARLARLLDGLTGGPA